MKCKDVRLELEPLLRGELTQSEQEAMNSHLKGCPACSKECQELRAKLVLLGGDSRGAIAPTYLEDRVRRHFARLYHRKQLKFRIAVAIALLLAFLGTVYAQGFLTEFLGFDSGVKNAILQGAGQVVNECKTVDGITVNLHSLVSDPNRSVVLYSIVGAPVQADSVHIRSIIQPHTGTWSNTYAFDNGIVSGQIETGGRGFPDQLEVEFNQLCFTRTHTHNLPLEMGGDYPQIVTLPDGAGQIILQAVEVTDKWMKLVIISELKEPYIAPADLDSGLLVNLFNDGEPLGAGYMVGQTFSQWPLDILGNLTGEFSISLSYYERVAIIEEPIVFAVRVDAKQAEKHTVVTKLNKIVPLGPGVELRILSLTASASQTALEFTLSAPEGMESFPDVSLRARGIAPQSLVMDSKCGGERPIYVLRFDPSIPLDQLELIVHGYELWHVYNQREHHECNLTILIP